MLEAKIHATKENDFFAWIIRIDQGEESNVIHGFNPRHFRTRAAAERATQKYIGNHNNEMKGMK